MVYYIIVKHPAQMLNYSHHSKCLILYLNFTDLRLQGLEIATFAGLKCLLHRAFFQFLHLNRVKFLFGEENSTFNKR